jgi:hypothetical protein
VGAAQRLELKSSMCKVLLLGLCFSPFQFWIVCKDPKKKYPQYVTNRKCFNILSTLDRFTGFGRFAAEI